MIEFIITAMASFEENMLCLAEYKIAKVVEILTKNCPNKEYVLDHRIHEQLEYFKELNKYEI